MGSFIGSGASGSVYMACHRDDDSQIFAIKSINVYDKNKRAQLKKDLNILIYNANCNFLVKYFGAFFLKGAVKIILEFMDCGSLDGLIRKVRVLPQPCCPESIISKMTQQILAAIEYLHITKHIIHRDLKPGNVLINSKGFVKLTDFGIARSLEDTNDFSKTFIGTRKYMAIERIMGNNYSYSSDIWALGLIVYELATGSFPYNYSPNYLEFVDELLNKPEISLPNDGTFSLELQDFVKRWLGSKQL